MENQLKKYVLDLRVVSVTPLHQSHVLLRLTHDLQLPEMLPGQFVEVRVDGSPTTFPSAMSTALRMSFGCWWPRWATVLAGWHRCSRATR